MSNIVIRGGVEVNLDTWANKPDPERIAEIMTGGDLAPCPFCGVPRVRRTDYVRCCRCGINWLDQEMRLTFKGKPYLDVEPSCARREERERTATKKTSDKESE